LFTDFVHPCVHRQFGIELDDVTTEKQIVRKEHHKQAEESPAEDEEVSLFVLLWHGCHTTHSLPVQIIYKIDIPANRYDMLCLEVRFSRFNLRCWRLSLNTL
jgi:phenylalanyl-tRNA synthetase beta chain